VKYIPPTPSLRPNNSQVSYRRHHTLCSTSKRTPRISCHWTVGIPPSGLEGLFSICRRIVESTLRSTNNLLERLHASFFFYLMLSPESFLKIGFFLPSVALVSAAMMFGGLWLWVDSGWKLFGIQPSHAVEKDGPAIVRKWLRRRRPVLPILGIMVATHALGLVLFSLANRPWVIDNRRVRHSALLGLLIYS
jgi:GPI-anchor transamidase subunit GAA1